MRIPPALALLLLPLVADCHVPAIDAPSLAPRAEEGRPILPPDDQPTEAASTLDPALTARISRIMGDADTGHRAFLDQARQAERLAADAARAPKGGEAWLAAQQAVSALDAAQAPLHEAATALNGLRVEPANLDAANRKAIDAAEIRIGALADAEARQVQRLSNRLQ